MTYEDFVLGRAGATENTAVAMEIAQKENSFSVRRHSVVEWGDDRIAEETSTLDGKENNQLAYSTLIR
jgi:hypothetical protein